MLLSLLAPIALQLFCLFLSPPPQKCVTALDQTWHPDHFFCAQCGCQFNEEGFQEKDGKAYCKSDYLSLFALKCKGCSMAITEGYISALSAQWHADCFVCRVSGVSSLTSSSSSSSSPPRPISFIQPRLLTNHHGAFGAALRR